MLALRNDFVELKLEMAKMRIEMIKTTCAIGFFQLIAVIGAVLGIIRANS